MIRWCIALALLILGAAGCATLTPRDATAACAATASFSFICGAQKPEDLARIPDTDWVVASGFSIGAGLKIINANARQAKVWFLGTADQIAPDPRYPDCRAAPDPALFMPRGITLRVTGPGKASLAVVNHGGREAIEMFAVDYRDGTAQPLLRWHGCLAMPPGHVANSVATYSDGTVLATVLTRPGTSITDFVAGRVTGGVFERHPGEAAFRLLPATELPGNNGLETARDDSGFYVVAFGTREVVAFDRRNTQTPLWRVIAPEFMPDNIHWDGDRLIAAGMMRDEPACGGVRQIVNGMADGMTCHRGYAVAQLDPATRRFRMIAYGGPDPVFNGVSAAVIVGNMLWLGSYQADRIAIRPLPDASQ